MEVTEFVPSNIHQTKYYRYLDFKALDITVVSANGVTWVNANEFSIEWSVERGEILNGDTTIEFINETGQTATMDLEDIQEISNLLSKIHSIFENDLPAEIIELVKYIERLNYERLLDLSLKNRDKEMFIRLTNGVNANEETYT